MPDNKVDIPFNGKWMTADPSVVGKNFQTLKNMRYTDTHIKAVAGMTKINASAVINSTYFKTRSAHHFRKSQPAESHILVQAYSSAMTTAQILENTTAVPNAGAFSAAALWTDTSGGSAGRFADAPDGQVVYCNGVDSCIWGGNEQKVGSVIQIVTALSAASDATTTPKYKEEILNNTKTDAANVMTVSTSSTYLTFLVGVTRPAKGATFYMASVNASANTLTIKESTAGVWTALSATSDGTRTGGTTSFAQNGKITWDSTLTTTKPKYIDGYYLYWYQFSVNAATCTISRITMDLEFQPIIDMWDGVFRQVTKFCVMGGGGTTTDYTTKVLEDDYDSASAETYLDMSGFAAYSAPNNSLFIQFAEKVTAIRFDIPPDYTNSTAATTAAVDYWNGSAFVTVGTITDGTSVGGVSFAQSGVMSWNNSAISGEEKKSLDNGEAWHLYQVRFDKQLDASVRLNHVSGITASKQMSHYKFPVFAQGRIFLCADMAGEKNKAVVSSKYMPQVYNGDDSVDVYFGEEGELTAGTELFSQYGSSLYSLILMFKDFETWVLAGQDIEQWENNTFLLSSSIGCPAPLTLKTINLRAEPGAGINRALAIWQGANGVYMSDGRAPIPIHGDIAAYFDKDDTRCIKKSKIGDSIGFVDDDRQEYHLLVASGSDATTLNTELVYDIARNRWFEEDRGSDLQNGVSVHDTDGNPYAYGFLDTGYMERLEYGSDFDGTAITCTVQTGDIPIAGFDKETRITDVTLFTVAKTNDIECDIYSDTSATGTAKTMTHTSSTRLAMPCFDAKLNGYFHSLKFSTTAAFEPIASTVWFHPL